MLNTLLFALTAMAVMPSYAFATDAQRRAATAYERNFLITSDVPENVWRRGDLGDRIEDLSYEDGWMDVFYGDIRDGGPAKRYIYLEWQYDHTGAGVVEIYHLDGSNFLRGEFSQTQSLTWDFD